MDKLKIIIITLGSILGCSQFTFSQDFIGLSYSIGIPTAAVNKSISDASFKGTDIEFRHFFTENISGGFTIGMRNFSQAYGNQVYTSDVVALTGETFKDATALSTVFTSHYYFQKFKFIQPYAGLGIGGAGVFYNVQVGGIATSDVYWGFTFVPEIGLLIPLRNSGTSILSSAKYNYQTGSKGHDSVGYWAFNIGIALDF
ncbi:hypothetical protein [Flammeovirga kamogawensis]|uniref:Outer membrane beta-barrel protein n=1 Tax=Flammeovirga kamogawensis TaxID=373891 RepID=A0ABX8H381_9BACT|nr:hypothetical protein [Flammeovirga kamogawensis]MBB6460268.1 outer membrane protein W [Flammeovirga kamogawensis]QWG10079.1 hypothetical protein KM029_20570 [Flammeovirga kamogawensis]TRX65586.1 hypothetical protein EO216_24000 [Flammeovirga kamogawensis]